MEAQYAFEIEREASKAVGSLTQGGWENPCEQPWGLDIQTDLDRFTTLALILSIFLQKENIAKMQMCTRGSNMFMRKCS